MIIIVIVIIVAIVILIASILTIVALRRRHNLTTESTTNKINSDRITCTEARESSWRLRWFIISGDVSINPFEWIIAKFPTSVSAKIRTLFDNKLYLYKSRLEFESEVDIAETESSLDSVNHSIASYANPSNLLQYRDRMNELDTCIFEQYDHLQNSQYSECNDKFNRCGVIIDDLINYV